MVADGPHCDYWRSARCSILFCILDRICDNTDVNRAKLYEHRKQVRLEALKAEDIGETHKM